MKKLTLFLLILLFNVSGHSLDNPNIVSEGSITNFTQLVRAVESGHNVRAIIYFDKCILQNQNENVQLDIIRRLEDASTRFNFNIYLHARETIDNEFRDTVTTTMKVYFEHPSTGDIWSLFGRLRVFEDNRATVRFVFINPITHKRQLILDWLCEIRNNNNINVNNINNVRDERGLVLIDGS